MSEQMKQTQSNTYYNNMAYMKPKPLQQISTTQLTLMQQILSFIGTAKTLLICHKTQNGIT